MSTLFNHQSQWINYHTDNTGLCTRPSTISTLFLTQSITLDGSNSFRGRSTYSFRSCAHGVNSREHDHESIWTMLESQLDCHPSPVPTPPNSVYSQPSPARAFSPVPSLILTGATAGFQTWNEGSPQMIPARGVPMQISPFI